RCGVARHATRSIRRARSSVTPSGAVRATMPVMAGHRSIPRIRRLAAVLAGMVAGVLGGAVPTLAHGPVPTEPPTATSLLLGWTFEPLPRLGTAAPVGCCLWAVRRVDAAHPANPVPRRRTAAFLAGMTALAFALLSGI